jgi:hypothetical protein
VSDPEEEDEEEDDVAEPSMPGIALSLLVSVTMLVFC